METRHLRCFVAVAEELSFTRAAERLHLTQPALSRTIRSLETTLGVHLLERNTRRVALTRAGATLLPQARELLRLSEAAVQTTRLAAGRVEGELELVLAFDTGLALDPVLRSYRGEEPDVRVKVSFATETDAVDAVRAGDADAAFAWSHVTDEDLHSMVATYEPVVGVLPREHPLAAQRFLTRETIARVPFVFFDREFGAASWDVLVRDLFGRDEPPPHTTFAGTLGTVQGAMLDRAADERAFTVATRRMFEYWQPTGMVARPLAPVLSTDVRLIWRPPASPALAALVAHVRRVRDAPPVAPGDDVVAPAA